MTKSIPITVIVPVKNEAKNIEACLSRLHDFDELIVVDSLSEDGTQHLAEKHGAKVIDFNWDGHYPKKRNWTLDHIELRNEWVLFLDADEFISADFIVEVQEKIKGSYSGFWIRFDNFFMGSKIRGDDFSKLALFKKSQGRYERIDEDQWSRLDMEIHEHAIVEGEIGRIMSPVTHHDFRGLSHYIEKHNEYSSWEAQRYCQSRLEMKRTLRQKVKGSLLGTWWLGPLVFLYLYFVRMGCLDGKKGFMFAALKSQYFFQIKCKIEENNMKIVS